MEILNKIEKVLNDIEVLELKLKQRKLKFTELKTAFQDETRVFATDPVHFRRLISDAKGELDRGVGVR